MGTIAEKLTYLNETKASIKQALIDKGVEVADTDTFRSYADKIASIEVGSGGTDMLQYKIDNTQSLAYEFYKMPTNDIDNTVSFILQNINTSSVTNMTYMFKDSTGLKTIPHFDTSSVTNMSYMFSSCNQLGTIPQFNTSNVTSMSNMFSNCNAIITIPQFNTSKVTDMSSMFNGCKKLETVPQLDISNVTSMSNMFSSCTALISVAQFTSTGMNTNMYGMFNGCTALKTIQSLDMINASSINNMFNNCKALENLTLRNIKKTGLTIGSGTTYGHLLTVDSLVNTIKELWDYSSGTTTYTLTMGTANTPKLANVYVKLITATDEMIAEDPNINSKMPCEVCESTDEGAMLIMDYAALKKWTIS